MISPRLFLLSFIAFIFCACSSNSGSLSEQEIFEQINQEVLANSEAYPNLEKVTSEIGHRLTGSENGKQAEEFTFNLFEKYGYAPEFGPFEVNAWMRDTLSLKVKAGENEYAIETVSLAHSPLNVELTGNVIDIRNGLREDFELHKELVAGNIVIAHLGISPEDKEMGLKNLHRSEKTALAIEYGAAGIILVNGVDENVLLTGTASVTGELIGIPALCIGKEDGAKFRALLAENSGTANIFMRNKSEAIQARNIIARIEGSEFPDETIVIGGHLDSWDLSTGAIDNGIGSFAVIEIARVFKALNLQTKRSIEFVMFMGEEQGLLGSKSMVEKRVADGSIKNISCIFNLDMSGNAIGFNIGGRDELENFVTEKGAMIMELDTLFKNKIRNRAGLHSDHQPFMIEGVPVMGMVSNLDREVYKFYHSNGDDFHLVNENHMNNGVRFTAMMLYALANVEDFPARQLDSEETRIFLETQDLKEKLVLGKDWKWEE